MDDDDFYYGDEPSADNPPPSEAGGPSSGEPTLRKVVAAMQERNDFIRDSAGNYYLYDAGRWRELTKHDLDRLVYEADPKSITGHRRNEAIRLLGAIKHKADFSFGRVDQNEVPFANGVLNVLTGVVREHDPKDYLEHVIPWNYNPHAQCPAWEKVLLDWFEDPEDGRHDAVQEFAGYIGFQHCRYKRALMCKGDGDTGKSVLVQVLCRMVGPTAYSQLGLEHMDDPQKRPVLKSKMLNVATEVTAKGLLADAGFKALVAGDPLLMDRKYHDLETYTATAKHVIACNTLPAVRGRTREVFDRFVLVPFTRVFPDGVQDPNLIPTIAEEMEGVCAWAMRGAKRLLEQGGRFTQPRDARTVLDDWGAEQNLLVDFVNENMAYDKDKKSFTLLSRIAALMTERYRRPITARQVGAWARELNFQIGTKRIKGGDGEIPGTAKAIKYWRLVAAAHDRSDLDFHEGYQE